MHYRPNRGGVGVSWLLGWLLLLGGAVAVPAQAQNEVRFGHASVLLPDGNILVVGGAQNTNQFIATTTLLLEGRGSAIAKTNVPIQNGGTGRAFHTATLMPNGEVLVVGGRNGAGVENSWTVYSPSQSCWRAVTADANAARYHHTATLLKAPASMAGKVLICGGVDGAGNSLGTCSLFTPTIPASAGCAAEGSIAGTTNLLVPRSSHTATLLSDGRVFLTGGYDTTATSPAMFMNTSEIFSPFTGAVSGAKPLITARTGHKATLIGNGKVLISGGFSGRSVLANEGILDSAELYDPVADSMSPAGKLKARVRDHAALLDVDGSVKVYGGLGNITTTYVNLGGAVDPGSFITGATSGRLPLMNITGGSLIRDAGFALSVPATGVIEDGVVLFSTPQLIFSGGNARFPYGVDGNPPSGLYADMGNTIAYCPESGPCGRIDTTYTMALTGGQYFFFPVDFASDGIASLLATSTLTWTGSFNNGNSVNIGAGSQLRGFMTITGLNANLIGGTVTGGTMTIAGGTVDGIQVQDEYGGLTSDNSITATISQAFSSIPINTAIISDGEGGAQITFFANIGAIEGTVATDTTTMQTGPRTLNGLGFETLSGSLLFGPSRINLDSGETLTIDVATVIVKSMIFSDLHNYDPTSTSGNEWTYKFNGFGSQRYGHTMTLTPAGDFRLIGGRTCDLTSTFCASQFARGISSFIQQLPGWSAASAPPDTPRGNHTATLLPSGKILIAGGTNGPNVLNSALLYNPVTSAYTQTGSMFDARDLHTATLLPNGRVLVAGGFTTNNTSTGPTSSAELYLAEIGKWVRTRDMPYAADNHTAVLLADGNVLVAGGYTGGVYLSSAAIYYSTSGAWVSIPDMPTRRALHTATLLQDGRVLIAGGINQTGTLCSTVMYNPNVAGDWQAASNIGSPSCDATHSHTATLMTDGQVLIVGGNDGFGETIHTRLYDPYSNTWVNPADFGGSELQIARFNHTATALPSGAVLVAGGATALGNALRSVETYSVGNSSWQIVGALTAPRALHTMTLGTDGVMYAIGGHDGVGYRQDADQLYITGSKDGETPGAPPSPRLSSITLVDMSPFNRDSFVTVTGTKLLGVGEAGGGGSSHHGPRLHLQAVGGSGGTGSQGDTTFVLDITTKIYQGTDSTYFQRADTSITVRMPPNGWPAAGLAAPGGTLLPYGWYHLRAYQNAVFSDSKLVQAGPPLPSAAVTALAGTPTSTDTVVWSWTGSGTFDGFNVYSATTGVLIATRPASLNNFTQTGLAANTTAQIAVAMYTLSGDGPLSISATYYTLSTAPTNVAISSVSFDRLTLTWNFNGNAQGTIYEISQSTDDFQTGPAISTPVPTLLGVTTNNALITGLVANTTYYFRLRAFNGLGLPSSFSAVVSTRTRAPVTGLSGAALTATSIQWNWLDPGGVSYFNVYNATSGAIIATTNTSTFIDLNLATNTARALMISAVTNAGEGPLSNSATVYTLASIPLALNPPYINITTGSFTAVWSANGNPLNTTYELIRTSETTAIALETTTTSGFNASFANLAAALRFGASVRALNQDGIATAFQVLGTSSTLARAPTGLTVAGTTPNSITIFWSNNSNTDLASYEVTYTTDGFASIQTGLPFSSLSAQLSLTVNGLLTGTTYEFRVRAQNVNGAPTAYSASVTTAPFNGGAPAGQVGGVILASQDNTISGTVAGLPPRAVSLFVPLGAFPSDVFVAISSITVPPSPCGALGTSVGVSVTLTPPMQPAKPLFLTLAYTAGEVVGINLAQAALNRVDDVTGRCAPLRTNVDTGGQTVTAQLNHLSTFQLAQVSPSASASTTRVYPNPYFPDRGHQYVTFADMPAGARLRVFTMRGEQIFEGFANASGLAYWNGLNRTGRQVASGVYLAVIESGGDKAIKKVVVLR